jgi:transposase InsO family protein
MLMPPASFQTDMMRATEDDTVARKTVTKERQPGPGVIHHSDQEVQYASSEYVGELKRCGLEISMARTGNPYQNAMMQSFFPRH